MQSLNRTVLKYIALAAMLSDHIAMAFLPENSAAYFFMRLTGRLTAAVMCFFIAEGFSHTSSKLRYGIRLGVFALIAQFAYTFFHAGTLLTPRLLTDWNVVFTLFIGFCILLAYEKIGSKPLKWGTIVLLCAVSSRGDWMIIAPLWILCFYIFRDQRSKQWIVFALLSSLYVAACLPFIVRHGELWQCGVFLVIPLLCLYNGKRGGDRPFHKWVFYLFYPLHLLVLALLKLGFRDIRQPVYHAANHHPPHTDKIFMPQTDNPSLRHAMP